MLHLPSMLTYGFLSFSMAFLNKALFEIAHFQSSLFVILFQLIFVIVSFHLLSTINILSVPTITRHDAHAFLVPSIFFCLSTILSLQALMKLNVAIYVVIKRCTPALTFVLSAVILKKQKLDWKTGLCVFGITIGAVITSIDGLSYHPESYIIGTLSVIFQSLYLLTIQRSSEQKSSSEVLYINSLLSLPMIFVLLIFFTDEVSAVQDYQYYGTFSFCFYFLTSTLGGGLLNGATFWCTIHNSALTTSVVGVLKSILQIFFGMFVFDRLAINGNTVLGILLSLIAGTMFSYFEYIDRKKKKSAISMNKTDCEQQNQCDFNTSFDKQTLAPNSEKSSVDTVDETRLRTNPSN